MNILLGNLLPPHRQLQKEVIKHMERDLTPDHPAGQAWEQNHPDYEPMNITSAATDAERWFAHLQKHLVTSTLRLYHPACSIAGDFFLTALPSDTFVISRTLSEMCVRHAILHWNNMPLLHACLYDDALFHKIEDYKQWVRRWRKSVTVCKLVDVSWIQNCLLTLFRRGYQVCVLRSSPALLDSISRRYSLVLPQSHSPESS